MYDGVHTMNKIFPLLISVLLLTSTLTYAQQVYSDKGATVVSNKNAIYLELLGNGFLYSINYERSFFKNSSLRLGAAYGPGIGRRNTFVDRHITLPILINYHLKLSRKAFLEAGLGTTLVLLGEDSNIYYTSSIGLKSLNPNTGHFIKFSLTPYSKNKELHLNLRVGYGISFGKEF